MADINQIFITGRLGQEPEIKCFESGAMRVLISVGVNRWNKKAEKEIVTWFNCVAWGKLAEYVGEYIKKGDMVFISGSLQKEVWKDDSGNTKSNTYILIEQIKGQSKKQQAV